MTPHDVSVEYTRRGGDRLFSDRVRDMADHAYTITGRRYGDRTVSGFTGMRVAKGWPLKGNITLYREDGATVRLGYGKRKGFTVKVER